MSLTTIQAELTSQIMDVAGLPPVKSEDENFTPKSTKDYPFARITMLPAESRQRDINSGKQILRGLVRIDLFVTRSLNTTAASKEVAESIVDAMRPATQTVLSDCSLQIEASWIEATRYDGTVANIPIFVRWNSLEL